MAENVGRRGSGWYYRLELPPDGKGQRRQKRVGGFVTEREAKAALAKAQVDVAGGQLRYAPARTFADLAGEWLTVVGPNRKATTAANYRLLVELYLVPRLGAARLDRITTAQIQRLYVELRAAGGQGGRSLSGTQVRNIHRVLHNVLGYAVRMGYLPLNPAERVERPKDDTAERPVYTPEQVRRLLEVAKDDRLYACWHLAITTGLRRGELAGLRWSDVSLEATPPLLTVRSTRTAAGNQVVESGPKTRSGRRTLVLDRTTVAAIGEHRERMDNERALVGDTRPAVYVFVDEFHEPLHPNRLTRRLHGLQDAAGLPRITLHDLRHTAATVAQISDVA